VKFSVPNLREPFRKAFDRKISYKSLTSLVVATLKYIQAPMLTQLGNSTCLLTTGS
jgi:hypothetical protein